MFIVCGPDPKICIYADNVCNQEVFQISFPHFFGMQNMNYSVYSWWKKCVILNTMSVINILLFYNSVYPMRHFHHGFSSS